MPMNGVCDLELRQMIEGAFLPDHCEVSCADGLTLTLHFPADAQRAAMTVSDVHLGALPDCRALAELVTRVRHEREQQALKPGAATRLMSGR
ncbi:DUF1652 domain-containing protein [Pseudomonas japonica]|uniref:DUF1652 domain-containing protein n=1 Tax=Pseudomonas japonica TaxID=256466 RepID=A0A239KMD8_9PSED|nr:DUF1652 domain-containing protein [Pseudomonas japonica]SNT19567.1 Protein of unknown function [Pseudomonas japonica]